MGFVDDRESSSYFEILAFLVFLLLFGRQLAGLRVRLETDSASSADMLNRWATRSPSHTPLLEWIMELLMQHHTLLLACPIPRDLNQIADALSVSQVLLASELCTKEFGTTASLGSTVCELPDELLPRLRSSSGPSARR